MSEGRRFAGAIDVFDLELRDPSVSAGAEIALDVLARDESKQGLARDSIETYTNLSYEEASRVLGAVATSLNELRTMEPQDFIEGPARTVPSEASPQLAALEAVQQDMRPVDIHQELQDSYGLPEDASQDIAAQAARDMADLDSLTYSTDY